MREIIVYCSKTGFTKRYAQWLQESLGCSCIPWEEVQTVDLGSYDTVIFASWIHAGKIQRLSWFLSQPLKAASKIVLVTGAAAPDNQETRRTLEANFKDCQQEEYKAFYLQSGLCYEKMGWKDRLMMKAFSKMLDRMKEKDGTKKEMAGLVKNSFDYSKRENLQPVIEYVERHCR